MLFARFRMVYFNRRSETNGENVYFSRMDVVCKSLYIVIVVVIFLRIVISIASYILKEK